MTGSAACCVVLPVECVSDGVEEPEADWPDLLNLRVVACGNALCNAAVWSYSEGVVYSSWDCGSVSGCDSGDGMYGVS